MAGLIGVVITAMFFVLLIIPLLAKYVVRAPTSYKKCYTGKNASGKMRCSKTTDSAFFPMESEDYTEAYQYQKRYGGG
jgi:hypothetical protein